MDNEEMSGRWLSDGRELKVSELNEIQRHNRTEQSEKRFKGCQKSFLWLQSRLGLKTNFGLAKMLKTMDIEGSASFYYPPRVIPKPEGGTRIIITPKPELMLVQKRLHKLLRRTFPRPQHSFGYRGGSCLELVKRHQTWTSTIKFDVRDAFFQVGYARLRSALRGRPTRIPTQREEPKWQPRFLPGFSKSVAHWIARLCTYSPVPNVAIKRVPGAKSFLAQGAPTSSICFDLACKPLDTKLKKIAKKVKGTVSRYADNYYFSVDEPIISHKLEAMVVCSSQKRYGFPTHKLRKVGKGELCRMLGYNLVNGEIHNTREFHRKLRGALYVLKTKFDRGLDWQSAYRRVRGLMEWAINLPDNLQSSYADCIERVSGV